MSRGQVVVYYEAFDDMDSAIFREKQLKAGSRRKKVLAISHPFGSVIDEATHKTTHPSPHQIQHHMITQVNVTRRELG
jgi:hypothetical protein